jgi:hypothetical protein
MRSVEGEMLIIGKPPALTSWQTFVRLQKRARLLFKGKGLSPGVYRLKAMRNYANGP